MTLLVALLLAPPVDEAAREAAMFGEDAPPVESVAQAPAEPPVDALAETLAVGGRLYLRTDAHVVDEGGLGDTRLSTPNLLDLYFDARPNDRVRGYARGRLRYDPTVDEADPLAGPETDAQLDQLWIAFDLGRRIFVTAGAFPVRWGVGRIWTPNDFVNARPRDALSQIDLRAGIPMLRVAMPFEGGQLQALAVFDEADRLDRVGGAARAEVAFEALELGASAAARRDAPLHLGADLSGGVGDVDLYAEVAVHHGHARRWEGTLDFATGALPMEVDRNDDWIPQAVAGLEWNLAFGDDDAVVLGAEYLFNDAGYDDPDLYPWLAVQGDLVPFYIGRHYLGVFALLAAPGSWDDTTFVLTGLGNVDDRSVATRLQVAHRALAQLWVEPYVTAHLGEPGGEFTFELAVPAFGDQTAFSIPRPYADVGVWLRVEM